MAFSEHGAIMTATVLSTPRAVEVSVYVVRAFLRLREFVASNQELAKRLDELEATTQHHAFKNDAFANTTRKQLKDIFEALRQLTAPHNPPKRPIGFVTDSAKK
jgi:hypothetical protein